MVNGREPGAVPQNVGIHFNSKSYMKRVKFNLFIVDITTTHVTANKSLL